MSHVLLAALPLSGDTKQAWREAGGIFMRSDRETPEILDYTKQRETFFINLGRSSFRPDEEMLADHGLEPWDVWNRGENINQLLYPGQVRTLLDEFAIPRPEAYPADVWIKTPGRQGRGTFRKHIEEPLVLPKEWDWQEHMEGQEYRCITVGPRIVQNFERHGSNGDREYRWTLMEETPAPVKTAVRKVAKRLDGYNVVAWDAILTPQGVALIFEGNTCPGMSINTARRVVNEINRQREEARNA